MGVLSGRGRDVAAMAPRLKEIYERVYPGNKARKLLRAGLLRVIVPKEKMAEGMAINPAKASGGFGTFERYLSLWVALCMVAGIGLGKLLPEFIAGVRGIE